MTIKAMRETMRRLARDGDRESYDELWHAVHVLSGLGLLPTAYVDKAVLEDHRLFESGEAEPMLECGGFNLDAALDLFEEA